jgi:hypothetical protein
MGEKNEAPLIEAIPDEGTIRLELARLTRRQQLLRGMLRPSRQKAEAMERERLQASGRCAATA